MTPLLPALFPSPAIRVPYAQATAHQLALALAYVVEELGPYFPSLQFPSWSLALAQEQPALWVEADFVGLDEDDLTRLAQRLATSPELPQDGPPIYPDQACYLARKMVKFQDQALHALTEIEANPHAFGYAVYALILDLAAGNGIAQQVYRVTHRQTPPRPGGPDPVAARLAAPASRPFAAPAASGPIPMPDPRRPRPAPKPGSKYLSWSSYPPTTVYSPYAPAYSPPYAAAALVRGAGHCCLRGLYAPA